MDGIVPDHGHLMHLFLVRTPALDRIWHLHPARQPDGSFVDTLPSLEPGRYSVFADIVDESGFPWTLVGSIDLPQINGTPLTGDDSGGQAPALTSSSDSAIDVLDDGTRVVWHRDNAALRANVPMILRFEVQDQNGKPATDVENLHGNGRARRDHELRLAGVRPHPSVRLSPDGVADDGEHQISRFNARNGYRILRDAVRDIAGAVDALWFPQPGHYRIFLQFKRANKIETAHFDTAVN